MIEKLVLNPSEFTDRTEVDLQALGLEIAADPGPDYGESSVTVERVRQMIGEGVTDRRWPSVECTIPLIARATDEVTLAEALNPLEATVADIQRRGGGWIRRDFSTDGGFAGSLGCAIDAAGLTGIQGWTMAHRQFANQIILKLSRYPIWLATTEVEGEEVSASEARDLKFELAEMLGTAPGLIRLRVKNTGEDDWRGIAVAIECDDYSADSTADLAYECESLTLGDAVEEASRTGASGGKVARATLSSNWTQVLSEEWTHVGVRRLKLRVYDDAERTNRETQDENQARLANGESALAEVQPQLQLEWRPLGASTWSQNKVMEAPLVEGFSIVDLGEARCERASIGDQRWEFRLMARVPSGTATLDLDRIYPLPVEQMQIASTPPVAVKATHNANATPGTVSDDAAAGSAEWEKASGAEAEGGEKAKVTLSRLATSHYLKAVNFGTSWVPSTAVLGELGVNIVASELRPGYQFSVYFVRAGVIDASPWDAARYTTTADGVVLQGPTPEGLTAEDVRNSGFGVAIVVRNGTRGNATIEVDAISLAASYAEEVDDNKVCFAGRSLEFNEQGIQRQHPEDEVWGPLIPGAGVSALLAPPGGLEKRTARGIIIPSQGDFAATEDAETVSLSIVPTYRAGYLFCREAAS